MSLASQAGMMLALTLPWLNPWASGPSPSVPPWLVTLACVALVLLFVPVRQLARPGVVATAWLLAALISSVIGLCQYFGVAQYFAPWMNPSDAGVAFANLRQRNQFATLANIGLVVLLCWGARRHHAGRAGLRPPGLLLAAGLLALGNAASSSRTGLVQLGLIVGLALLWGRWRQPVVRTVLLVAVLTYGLAALLLPGLAGLDPTASGILSRFQSDGPACGSRLILWRNVLELTAQRPWLGWGWGELDYAHFMHLYAGPRFCEILGNAHNLPLHLAVTLGLPLAGLICGALLWLVLRARPWREREPARQLAWGVLALILLHSLLEYPLWYGPFLLAFCLCLGLLWPQRKAAVDAVAGGRVARWQRVGAAAVLAALVYAAWDYQRISQIYLNPTQRAAAYREDTLEKIRNSWLFDQQVRFAELTLTPVTGDNAAQLNALAHELLHYSPEARVVEKLIESAVWLGRDAEALLFLARYRAAYPQAHARWAAALSQSAPLGRIDGLSGPEQPGPNGQ